MTKILKRFLPMILASGLAAPALYGQTGQARRPASAPPSIEVTHFDVKAALQPDAHEIKAVAAVTFQPMAETDIVLFQISENLSVMKVLNERDVELEFAQDETGPGILSVRFAEALPAGVPATIKIEYEGGFDRDRFSRNYVQDESSAYIGMEGTYLNYQAKWFPINRFLVDRASATFEITVPLGMTAVGPGRQLPVVTHGITETFGWSTDKPVLAGSVVAGQYFEKKVKAGELELDCFAREDHLEEMEKRAETVAAILDYYGRTFGPSASGKEFRLVEVDDLLTKQPGTLGTIYITHDELTPNAQPERDFARRIAYQWWMDSVGVRRQEDLWLVDGLSYYSAALYLGDSGGPEALREELNNLAVLALKFESKGAVRVGMDLGYRTEAYESVVAGKGAWILNMLSHIMGPEQFTKLLTQYLAESEKTGGSTAGFQKLAEQLYGKELGWFFAEWIDTTGVPLLETDYVIYRTRDGFRVSGSVKQDNDLFRMPLDLAVVSKDETSRGSIELNGKATAFDIDTFALPEKVLIDPDNKILRDSEALQLSVQLSMGDDLKAKTEYVEAIRAYERALKINPRKSLVHFRLAEVFYEQFNLQAAANTFRDALNGDKDPAWIEVWSYIYLGKIYDILGQRQRAMAEYNKALNTKNDTFGAQEEAKKWLATPFTRERTTMEKSARQPAG